MREADAATETTPRAGEPAFFFNFVRSAYESFLAEEDERVDETKAAVADAFGACGRALVAASLGRMYASGCTTRRIACLSPP